VPADPRSAWRPGTDPSRSERRSRRRTIMRTGNIALITLLCAVGAAAQERVTIPLSNPAQPVTQKVSTLNGSIRVTAGTGRDVIVNAEEGEGRRRDRKSREGAPP